DALKKQINPHFLFNSFNVLSSVIETDSKLAVQFVEQLSNVYRYLLQTQEEKTVSLEDELAFIDSYIFLLKIRFGENLLVKKHIEENDLRLPPATLQLLIENAIKHNEVSRANPLQIELYRENGTLVVKNNKNPKKGKKEESSNIGLANIKNRYELLGQAIPQIEDLEEEFRVKIPLIPA
ncbi:MAG: histidine kinase, partial [Bacteroidota bacterium]